MDIQERLTLMREAKGLTLAEVEERSGIPFQTVRRIFEGTTKDPGISTARALVESMGYTLNDLYGDWPSEKENAPQQTAVEHHLHTVHFSPLKGDTRELTKEAIREVYASDAYMILNGHLKWWRAVAIALIALVVIWFTWDITHPEVGLIQYTSAHPTVTGMRSETSV